MNVFTMTFVISYLTFFLLENFAEQGSVFIEKSPKSDIFILDSEHTRKTLNEWGLDSTAYTKQLDRFISLFSGSPYRVKKINGGQLPELSKDSVLLVLDAITLSNTDLFNIESYVNQGGSLMINHQAGFNDPSGNHRGGTFINAISGLEYDQTASEKLAHEGLFVTPKIFSPLTEHLATGKRLSLIIYEQLPLFRDSRNRSPDLLLTNWARTSSPEGFNKKPLPINNAGAMWHGLKERGRWVYFNFPSYVFEENSSQETEFNNLLIGAMEFLRLPSQIRVMPYLDKVSASVIFEDVEYQYETIDQFIDLAEKYQVPFTTFQVAQEALLKPHVLARSHQSPLIEVGSHSYSHGEIVNQSEEVLQKELTESKILLSLDKNVVEGFRPPREEIDQRMIDILIDEGYGYLLAGAQDELYPQIQDESFVILPRTGTDDYEYFVKGEMSSQSILKNVLHEEAMVRALNGVYTFGVHTHLMTYGKNIEILDQVIKKMKQNKAINFMTAAEVVNRVRLTDNIEYGVNATSKNHIINVTNHNDKMIEQVVFRLFWQGSESVNKVTSDIIGARVSAKHFKQEKYSDIIISNFKANAHMTIVASYE